MVYRIQTELIVFHLCETIYLLLCAENVKSTSGLKTVSHTRDWCSENVTIGSIITAPSVIVGSKYHVILTGLFHPTDYNIMLLIKLIQTLYIHETTFLVYKSFSILSYQYKINYLLSTIWRKCFIFIKNYINYYFNLYDLKCWSKILF